MEKGQGAAVLREIQALYTSGTLVGLSDAELLERFLARDGNAAEDAFAALMHRHGPIVLGACRRMLPRSHDAEDVFQATFLVLARRAASIGRRELLASWLYGVAVRIARDARRRAARQGAGERRLMEFSRVETEPAHEPDDVLPMLDEELNRLPRHYREALVACELEGKSRRDAAERLGIPEGTLSTHLARGRKRLRERLLRRGVTLGLGPIAGQCRPALDVPVLERLVAPTVRAATGSVPGVRAAVSTLAERAIKMMFLSRLTLIAVALLAAASGVTAGAVSAGASRPRGSPSSRRRIRKRGRTTWPVRSWINPARVWRASSSGGWTALGSRRTSWPGRRPTKRAGICCEAWCTSSRSRAKAGL